jgi:pimeloyl-ACP methyl ester carboxylesterase
MHARNDRVFPFQNALTLKEGLKDKGELFVMEQAAHIFFQEKPVEFNEKLHLFLKK